MKKGVTISLILLLFYTQLGYYGQFLIQQWRLKAAAHAAWVAALPDASLFRVSLADVRWEEEGREIWFHDHLYDVIRQKTSGGQTWLYCLDDKNEERLIRRSGEFTHAQPDKKTSHLLSIRIGDVVCDDLDLALDRLLSYCPTIWCSSNYPLPIRYTEITVPPPKA